MNIHQIWGSWTTPISKGEDEARRERMTRMIYLMVGIGLTVMSIIIPVFDFLVGEPSYFPTLVILFIDCLMVIGWRLISSGYWYVSRYLLPAIFLALAAYIIIQVGLITTGVMQLAIAVVLTSMLFGARAQWNTVFISMILYLLVGWLAGERNFEIYFTGGIVVGASLSGIAALQWYATTLLNRSIADLRAAESSSRRSAEKTRAIFESIQDGIIITDLQGLITGLNDATVRLHGYERQEELLGRSSFDLIAISDHPRAAENLHLALTRGSIGSLEYRLLRKDGSEFDGELNAVLIKDEAGQPVEFVTLTRDVTSRKKAQEGRETLIAQLSDEIAERNRAQDELQQIARTDPLTGLFNRRHFFEIAGKEFAASIRYGRSLSVVILDLDLFKDINDTYGHLVGDQALIHIGNLLRKSARDPDIPARYGGEEFIVLLPETNFTNAQVFAERLRKLLEDSPVYNDNDTIHFTASFGVAGKDDHRDVETFDHLISQADQALYEAKRTGRNRVVCYFEKGQNFCR